MLVNCAYSSLCRDRATGAHFHAAVGHFADELAGRFAKIDLAVVLAESDSSGLEISVIKRLAVLSAGLLSQPTYIARSEGKNRSTFGKEVPVLLLSNELIEAPR